MSHLHLAALAFAFLLGLAGGYFLGKRYGSAAAAEASRLENTVSNLAATVKKDV